MEWATKIGYFCPNIPLSIIHSLPSGMGSLLDSFAEHWSAYINACGLKESYLCLYVPLKDEIMQKIELPSRPDV